LVYRYMRDLLKDNEQFVDWNIPTAAYTITEICGRNIMCLHGSGIRSTMPGVPWSGVSRRANNLALNYQKQANKGIDMFVLGHFHNGSFVTSDAGQIVLNGSVKGVDEYSLQAFGGGRPAQQFLLTLHKSHGVTDVSMLDLQEHD
jgi:predicted phosphodiesterase